MDWRQLGKQLAQIGLPILGTAVAGPAGAAVGRLLGNALSSSSFDGGSAKPQDILATLSGNVEALQKAREFEASHGATILKMHLDALQASDKNQTDINLADANSGSLFKSGWRPAAGWTCVGALQYQFIVRPIFSWVAKNLWAWEAMPSLETDTLMTLLFGLLGLGAYRTVERIRGKV